MKHLIKRIAITLVSIVIVSYLTPGLSYSNNFGVLIAASVVLSLANAIIKPILKVIFLPITFLTFGLFNWFLNAIILYLTTLITPDFTVNPFTLQLGNLSLVLSIIWAYVVISFFLSFTSSVSSWIFDA